MILYLGDSLTCGTVGHSYLTFMGPHAHKNKGLNGDTTFGAWCRLQAYRRRPWYKDVETCVVEIGTNDILQPYMFRDSLIWSLCYKSRASRKRWARTPDAFEALYREIVETLTRDGKRVILVGLSVMELKDYPWEHLREENEQMRRVGADYGAEFVDMLSLEERERPVYRRDYKWGKTGFIRALDILTMVLLPFTKDKLSKARGLALTVDGVHFNSFAARLLAEQLEKILK